jgi:hypothetical protein
VAVTVLRIGLEGLILVASGTNASGSTTFTDGETSWSGNSLQIEIALCASVT